MWFFQGLNVGTKCRKQKPILKRGGGGGGGGGEKKKAVSLNGQSMGMKKPNLIQGMNGLSIISVCVFDQWGL